MCVWNSSKVRWIYVTTVFGGIIFDVKGVWCIGV